MPLTDLTPQMSLVILDTLRANSVTASTINHDFDKDVRAKKGTTIDINQLKPMVTREVEPGNINPELGQSPIGVYNDKLTLDYYEEVVFPFTDRMYLELDSGVYPEALVKAVETLVTRVEGTLLQTMANHAYQSVGTAGTTPFGAGLTEATSAFRFLSTAKAPRGDRYMGLDPFAYANALNVPVLQKANEHGTDETLVDAMIRKVVGFDWYQNQGFTQQLWNDPTAHAVDAGAAVEATSVVVDDGAGGIPGTVVLPGTAFTFAGHTQTYVVKSATTQTDDVLLEIAPRLQAPVADGEAITFTITEEHTANFAYHSDAVWMASRLPANNIATPGSIIQVVTDPISNLAFSYEIVREHHQTSFKLSSLWGFVAPRPELLVKVMG